ncbi:MAG: NAD(P)-dependent oxidoreductase [Dehalococcoidia bacterium]|jgi:nucleoside-diphosphate-sugar epimerase|nr:NAD(P)-dependent oxidoreductase [Dehalococcoidia bacterium]
MVTGGTGLIGSRITRDLVREGQQVVVYDWLPNEESLAALLSEEEIGSMVKVVQGDVTDASGLFRTINENDVQTVIHTASLLALESDANPVKALRVNCEGTLCVFEAARTLGVKKVVWSSSNAAFGPPDMYPEEYIPNDAPHYPQTIYGATKSFNETAAAFYSSQYGVDITGIRYMHVYGGGQRRGIFATIVRELVHNPALGRPGRVPHRDAVIGWSYVDDPARASVMASKAPMTKTRSYSIMGDVRSVKEVADYVRQILPEADVTTLPGAFTGDPVRFDTGLIEEEIGYRPEWSMERGIRETINTTRREHGLPPV